MNTTGRWRKKPVVIDAALVSELIGHAAHSWSELPDWFTAAHREGGVVVRPEGIDIVTLEGTMTGLPDDYIIRGVKGELYPCKPDVFVATYEPAEE